VFMLIVAPLGRQATTYINQDPIDYILRPLMVGDMLFPLSFASYFFSSYSLYNACLPTSAHMCIRLLQFSSHLRLCYDCHNSSPLSNIAVFEYSLRVLAPQSQVSRPRSTNRKDRQNQQHPRILLNKST